MMKARMRMLAAVLVLAGGIAAQPRFQASDRLDALIEEAIAQDQIPGAVLLVGQPDQILHLKAYGWRALVPARETMTVDTIFDAASLTKVVATTPAVMKLFEWGKLRLNDRVTQYLPEFQGGESPITVRDLLTHFSGLRPDLDLRPRWSGRRTGIYLALIDPPVEPPGVRFIYSDINFLLLGEIVERLSGQPLERFVSEQIWQPLGMKDTMFCPPGIAGATDRSNRDRGRRAVARRRTRSHGAFHGRRRGPRRHVHHGRRSGAPCGNDAG
jgi:CubicO group peptidase (beta-lactamase class C family)